MMDTRPHIYTVNYELKGDKDETPGRTHRNNQGRECALNPEIGRTQAVLCMIVEIRFLLCCVKASIF